MSEVRSLVALMSGMKFEVQDTQGFGQQIVFFFENGFGASVSRNSMTGGNRHGLWEMALVEGDVEEWELVFDDGRFQDVSGWMTIEDVEQDLALVAALEADHEVFETAKMFRNVNWD